MNDTEILRVERSGPVRVLTMNRPHRRNALDAALVDALDQALDKAEGDPETHAVVLLGAGRSFCAGADLRYFLALGERGETPLAFLRTVSALATRLEISPLPVVAGLHGHAVAGGIELALACDVVVAAAGTLIGDGHVLNNLMPAGGAAVRMPRLLGQATARRLALTGELMPAERLAATGWPHEVVAPDEVGPAALRIAETLAQTHGPAQSSYKRLLAQTPAMETPAALALELDVFDAHWAAYDVAAALRDFVNRPATPRTEQPA
ncbi:enoyl-CoA hydratase/isomerase family protein [Frankia sp. AgB1.9]|uniref:enoyl-CoA hydratase/isomerase family protein n=1 Tax=unclassified Frankia TaxID=2632575 RepID=UPI001932F46F|nr:MULTISPECIES: enoyl-CoA hydratase/isomerase family protein [unclassified Frankia]MBL7488500.1 enoyl-CoA hydratase/isomerase family protein [Frankia sp. AgW1.1]MBL7547283.1 enoyl-CoA hydratase/isomerase family protein [Frankia sp. AgB1.9]MBL7620812.1 enoyl-CoA hydratase/isomerase family protein [Frankia sp. AgB1.8]